MGHEKPVKYRLICGDQKTINEDLLPADATWKPILMTRCLNQVVLPML